MGEIAHTCAHALTLSHSLLSTRKLNMTIAEYESFQAALPFSEIRFECKYPWFMIGLISMSNIKIRILLVNGDVVVVDLAGEKTESSGKAWAWAWTCFHFRMSTNQHRKLKWIVLAIKWTTYLDDSERWLSLRLAKRKDEARSLQAETIIRGHIAYHCIGLRNHRNQRHNLQIQREWKLKNISFLYICFGKTSIDKTILQMKFIKQFKFIWSYYKYSFEVNFTRCSQNLDCAPMVMCSTIAKTPTTNKWNWFDKTQSCNSFDHTNYFVWK